MGGPYQTYNLFLSLKTLERVISMKDKNKELAARLRKWYAGGEKGLLTLCEIEGAPPAVIAQAKNWYKKGYARFDAIVKELEKDDE